MRILTLAVLALGLAVHGASAIAADERPLLQDVSAIRVANYGTPSTVINDRAQVNSIVAELRQLRSKAWRRADAKLSCYATLVLLSGTRTVSLFRIGPQAVVERSPGKGQSSHSVAIEPADLPGIGPLLAGIPPAKDCN